MRSENVSRVVVVGGPKSGRHRVPATRRSDTTIRIDGSAAGNRRSSLPGERVVVVKDYFSPPDEVPAGADAIVNFAGITGDQS